MQSTAAFSLHSPVFLVLTIPLLRFSLLAPSLTVSLTVNAGLAETELCHCLVVDALDGVGVAQVPDHARDLLVTVLLP